MVASEDELEKYLKCPSLAERLKVLEKLEPNAIGLPLVEDLMALSLHTEEKMSILRRADATNQIAFEDYITRSLLEWRQEVAVCGLLEWVRRSGRLLWHRNLALTKLAHIPQRVAYTLLDHCRFTGGHDLLEHFSYLDSLTNMSPAFRAIYLNRALEWNFQSNNLAELAQLEISRLENERFPEAKATIYGIVYLLRFFPEELAIRKLKIQQHVWFDVIAKLIHPETRGQRLKGFEQLMKGRRDSASWDEAKMAWPHLWDRYRVNSDHLKDFLEIYGKKTKIDQPVWDYITGVESGTIIDALNGLGIETFFRVIGQIEPLLLRNDKLRLIELIKNHLNLAEEPQAYVQKIPQRLTVQLNQTAGPTSIFGKIAREQEVFVSQPVSNDKYRYNPSIEPLVPISRDSEEDDRFHFIGLMTGKVSAKRTEHEEGKYWHQLIRTWHDPSDGNLDELTNIARKQSGVFKLCYVYTLGRFVGNDKAVLRCLDFIRSSEEDVIRAVAHSLSAIDTPRSHQELVAFLTRPNVSHSIKLEITQLLRHADLSGLQSELRSAISDIRTVTDTSTSDALTWELRESISDLLQAETPNQMVAPRANPDGNGGEAVAITMNIPTSESLDAALKQRITGYDELSGEAKRALRTSHFFHDQVESANDLHSIDLSPTIDMQYKAMELSFREAFEESVTELVQRGVLQTKLDVIGYARPIPSAMDRFERYIETLPIVHTIPFFSKFKLRKMLRALCQLRPGKRFTLDGLKAFGLFFICFSRKSCNYGLDNIYPIGNMTEKEILEFAKALHVFQDFRNRAAHEGFHPDASNDLDGIWVETENIISKMLQIKRRLDGVDYGSSVS